MLHCKKIACEVLSIILSPIDFRWKDPEKRNIILNTHLTPSLNQIRRGKHPFTADVCWMALVNEQLSLYVGKPELVIE